MFDGFMHPTSSAQTNNLSYKPRPAQLLSKEIRLDHISVPTTTIIAASG